MVVCPTAVIVSLILTILPFAVLGITGARRALLPENDAFGLIALPPTETLATTLTDLGDAPVSLRLTATAIVNRRPATGWAGVASGFPTTSFATTAVVVSGGFGGFAVSVSTLSPGTGSVTA